jgi:hypothetical protein
MRHVHLPCPSRFLLMVSVPFSNGQPVEGDVSNLLPECRAIDCSPPSMRSNGASCEAARSG